MTSFEVIGFPSLHLPCGYRFNVIERQSFATLQLLARNGVGEPIGFQSPEIVSGISMNGYRSVSNFQLLVVTGPQTPRPNVRFVPIRNTRSELTVAGF